MTRLWLILSLFLAAVTPVLSQQRQVKAGPLTISQKSYDFIVEAETGGKAYYMKRLVRPTWPGGASGVTIGLGYDLGYNTRAQIAADWSELPKPQLDALMGCAGMTGQRAKTKTQSVRWIVVPWDISERVFQKGTLPRFGKLTENAFKKTAVQHPDVQGAMLSLVFNRGASLTGASRREMKTISVYMPVSKIVPIPNEFRSMKRLWYGKGLDGLLTRREKEARMIEATLKR